MVDRVIRIILDADQLKRGLGQIKGRMDGVQKSTKRTGDSMRGLRTIAGGLIAALGVRQLIRYADTWTTIGNRIRLVTDSTDELNLVTREIVVLAQSTRTSLSSTADLYARVARSTGILARSQEEVLQFTEAVNLAIQISGATATEAAASTIQFAQGLGAGALRGDELRSVLEQNVRLSQAIAQIFETDIGDLKRLGEAGALTTEKLFGGIIEQGEQFRKEFKLINATVEQAVTTTKTFATVVIGSFNDAAGVTAGLVEIFALTGEETLQLADSVTNMGLAFRTAVEIATIATINFAEQVPTKLKLIRNELGKFVAFLVDDEAAFLQGLLEEGELEAAIDRRRAQLQDEIDLIQELGRARQDAILARNADLSRRAEGAGRDRLDPQALRDAAALKKAQDDLLLSLQQQEKALAIVQETGREYSSVLLEIKINTLAAKNANEEFRFDAQATREEIERLTAEIKANMDAEALRQERIAEAADITADARTEQERFNDELARLQGFLDEGLITPETFERSKANLLELDDSLNDFFRRARENSQDILAGFLESGLQDLDNFATEFANMLLRLASQALAAEIFAKILGPPGGGGGGFLKFLGGLFGGGAPASSGQFGSGVQAGQAINVSEGGRFGSEVFIPNQGGQVVPLGTDRGGGGVMPAPVVNLTNVNAFSEQDVVAAFQTGGGEQVILNLISSRQSSFRQALGIA